MLSAERLKKPPDLIIGIGNEKCSDFVMVYNQKQKIDRKEEKDIAVIAGASAAYADFLGTFGGFLASAMMEQGISKIPFKSQEHAMSLIYEACKQNPDARYIDMVYIMSRTAFGKNVKWK